MLIGQLAVMLNGVIDTVMAGRLSPADLAGVGLGNSIQISVYIALTGIILGIGPIAGQHYGAKRYSDIGATFQQGIWLACGLAVIGVSLLLATPIWMSTIQPPPEVIPVATNYLIAGAVGLPAALFFRVFYTTSTAISLPRVVMTIQLVVLVLKVPLNNLFIYGFDFLGLITLRPLGGAGCSLATAVLSFLSVAMALIVIKFDARYQPFGFTFRNKIDRNRLKEMLRLGVPIGVTYTIEVTSFTFIALMIARLGVDVAAAHQVTSNMLGMAYMLPLSMSNAISTLTAQAIGADDYQRARKTGQYGIWLVLAASTMLGIGYAIFRFDIPTWYIGNATDKQGIIAAAGLLIGILSVFIVFDALQTVIAFILRAYKVATLPGVIYAVCLWGIGLGGGWWITYGVQYAGPRPTYAQGAAGFWWAALLGLIVASIALGVLLRYQWKISKGLGKSSQAVRNPSPAL